MRDAPPASAGSPGDSGRGFERLGEDEVWRGWILSLGHQHWSAPDGERFDRDVVHHPGAVAVVPVHDDDSVTLVRQFRAPIGTEILEIPAGTRDVDGESAEVTARRELAEEVGLEAEAVELLASVYNSPGFTDQRTEIFMATGLTPCATGRGGVEERWMTVQRLPMAALDDLLSAGALDETTVLAVRLARDRLARARAGGR